MPASRMPDKRNTPTGTPLKGEKMGTRKKTVCLLTTIALTVGMLTACGGNSGGGLLHKDSGAGAAAEKTLDAMASGDWKTVNSNIALKTRETILKAKPSKPLLTKPKVDKTDTNGSHATATVTYTLGGKMTRTSLTLTQTGDKWKITDGLPLANLGGKSTHGEDDSGRAMILGSTIGDFYPATANGVKYPIKEDTVYAIPGTYKFLGTDPKGLLTAEWSSTVEGKDKGVAVGFKETMITATDKFKTKAVELVRKDLKDLDVCDLVEQVRDGSNSAGECVSAQAGSRKKNGDQHITDVDGLTIQSVDPIVADGGNPATIRFTLSGTVSAPQATVKIVPYASTMDVRCERLDDDPGSEECETYSNQPLDLTGAAYTYRLEDGVVVMDDATKTKIQQFAANGVRLMYNPLRASAED